MLAIISDIHSNYEALTTVYRYLDKEKIDDVICLGDVVGYGPEPNKVCDLIRQRCKLTLLGNHDAATIGAMATDYYRVPARDAIYWTRHRLSDENFSWLYSLPFTHKREQLSFFHAAPFRPSGWYYVAKLSDAEHHNPLAYSQLSRWNFVGHSHLTKSYVLNGSQAKEVAPGELEGHDDSKLIVNVGSVGQPRDRNPKLCFGIYDPNFDTFRHIRLSYDVKAVAQKIIDAGLSEHFAKRLFEGR